MLDYLVHRGLMCLGMIQIMGMYCGYNAKTCTHNVSMERDFAQRGGSSSSFLTHSDITKLNSFHSIPYTLKDVDQKVSRSLSRMIDKKQEDQHSRYDTPGACFRSIFSQENAPAVTPHPLAID